MQQEGYSILVSGLENFPGLFRSGFIFSDSELINNSSSEVISVIKKNFISKSAGKFTLLYHPDSEIKDLSWGDSRAIIIGDIFDNRGGDVDDLIAQLLESRNFLPDLAKVDFGGRHAIIFIDSNGFSVINDPFGSRSVHYTRSGIDAISSHAVLLAELLSANKGPKTTSYMNSDDFQNQKVKYLPGNITPWHQIQRLTPNHIFSSHYRATARYWPAMERSKADETELFEVLDQAFDALTSYVSKKYQPILGITGGVDTRMIAAGFLKRNCDFTAVTWENFNFDKQERSVVDLICDRFSISHSYINSKQPMHNSDLLSACAAIAGGDLHPYAKRPILMSNAPLQAPFAKKQSAFIIGYGGEILRAFYGRKGRRDISELSANFMTSLYSYRPFESGNKEFVMSKFREFRQEAHQDAKSLKGYPPHDIFYWEHRMGMWGSGTLDTIDPVLPILVGINSRRVFEKALSLPEKSRLGKDLQMRYIATQVPGLEDIQII